jgi:hypothetical protein
LPLLEATGRVGRYRIDESVARQLAGRSVLFVDVAIGHGDVLDEITLLAEEASAERVGAAVILSRLGESLEQALAQRLNGGFARLFSFAIPPREGQCPTCQAREVAATISLRLPAGSAKRLAEHLAERSRRGQPSSVAKTTRLRPSQLALFPARDRILALCRRSREASGATLNALYTAMGDGMAPLSLPELFDHAIPPKHKIAILEHLPKGVLEWKGQTLVDQLHRVLLEPDKSLAAAAVRLLAREGDTGWLTLLESSLNAHEAHNPIAIDTALASSCVFAIFTLALEAHQPKAAKQAANRIIRLRDRLGNTYGGAALREVLRGPVERALLSVP